MPDGLSLLKTLVEALPRLISSFAKSKVSAEDVSPGIRHQWESLRRHVRIQGASSLDVCARANM